MECKVTEVSQLTNARGEKVEGWFVLGEVVAVSIDKSLIEDGVYNTALARLPYCARVGVEITSRSRRRTCSR
jgi:flavin reductase (DIM6/NTAB) family NADH-FMN oxidoreductase RutF